MKPLDEKVKSEAVVEEALRDVKAQLSKRGMKLSEPEIGLVKIGIMAAIHTIFNQVREAQEKEQQSLTE